MNGATGVYVHPEAQGVDGGRCLWWHRALLKLERAGWSMTWGGVVDPEAQRGEGHTQAAASLGGRVGLLPPPRGSVFCRSQLPTLPEQEAEPGPVSRPLRGGFMAVPTCLILCFQYTHHTTYLCAFLWQGARLPTSETEA